MIRQMYSEEKRRLGIMSSLRTLRKEAKAMIDRAKRCSQVLKHNVVFMKDRLKNNNRYRNP